MEHKLIKEYLSTPEEEMLLNLQENDFLFFQCYCFARYQDFLRICSDIIRDLEETE